MKILFLIGMMSATLVSNAQSDSIRSAKDYIQQKEHTDSRMNPHKNRKLKKVDSSEMVVITSNCTISKEVMPYRSKKSKQQK